AMSGTTETIGSREALIEALATGTRVKYLHFWGGPGRARTIRHLPHSRSGRSRSRLNPNRPTPAGNVH
ncbi:hypothetical protein ABZ759_32660, partial [Streptomyces sp. NPDC047860]